MLWALSINYNFDIVMSCFTYNNQSQAALTDSDLGNTYSIRNVGSGTARVFFAQAMQTTVQDDE